MHKDEHTGETVTLQNLQQCLRVETSKAIQVVARKGSQLKKTICLLQANKHGKRENQHDRSGDGILHGNPNKGKVVGKGTQHQVHQTEVTFQRDEEETPLGDKHAERLIVKVQIEASYR